MSGRFSTKEERTCVTYIISRGFLRIAAVVIGYLYGITAPSQILISVKRQWRGAER